MAAECKACSSARVADLDRALDGGTSVRDVAAAFGLTKSTVQRHAGHRTRPETSPRVFEGELVEAPTRRACLVCRSPARDIIEAALLAGEPAEALEAHGPSADTIRRHARGCMVAALAAAREGRAADLVQQARTAIEELTTRARRLVADADGEGEDHEGHRRQPATVRERAAALAALARAAELLGKITGELGPDVEIRILELPQWAAIRTAIAEALEPYPDAAEAVIGALERIERGAPALLPASREDA